MAAWILSAASPCLSFSFTKENKRKSAKGEGEAEVNPDRPLGKTHRTSQAFSYTTITAIQDFVFLIAKEYT